MSTLWKQEINGITNPCTILILEGSGLCPQGLFYEDINILKNTKTDTARKK